MNKILCMGLLLLMTGCDDSSISEVMPRQPEHVVERPDDMAVLSQDLYGKEVEFRQLFLDDLKVQDPSAVFKDTIRNLLETKTPQSSRTYNNDDDNFDVKMTLISIEGTFQCSTIAFDMTRPIVQQFTETWCSPNSSRNYWGSSP